MNKIGRKTTKAALHFILAGIVSVISYLGFKKGVEAIAEQYKKSTNDLDIED